MIKAEPAFGSEPWEKDEWRNRILLSVGDRSWHLSREEAAKLSADLTTALKESEYETFDGLLETEGSNFYLVPDGGERVQIAPRDWSLMKQKGSRIQVVGRLMTAEQSGNSPLIFLREWSPIDG